MATSEARRVTRQEIELGKTESVSSQTVHVRAFFAFTTWRPELVKMISGNSVKFEHARPTPDALTLESLLYGYLQPLPIRLK